MYTLTGVTTKARIVLDVSLSYSVPSMDKTVTITPGKLYTFTYLEDGQLKTCSGRVTNVYKVEELEQQTNLYKVRVDCSTEYNHHVVVFKTDQLRGVEEYYQYAMEDSKVTDGYQEGGITIAQLIRDAIVVNAELDSEKNVLKGTIVYGILENATTVDGMAVGTNSSGHDIVLAEPQSTGGEISSGMLLNGVVRSGDIDGETEEGTGIVTNATIKGIITNAVIVNSTVANVLIPNGKGTVVEPKFEDSLVYGATVSGEGMVTTGGVTIGNMTTNGVTRGGVAKGGVAYGTIDGKRYTITGGITTGDISTAGGVVVGGTVVGGTKIGNAIYNATVTGGVVTDGVTSGGVTVLEVSVKAYKAGTEARIRPAYASGGLATKVGRTMVENPTYNQMEAALRKENRWSMGYDDLILATDRQTGSELYTNFGTANMEYVNKLGEEHKG